MDRDDVLHSGLDIEATYRQYAGDLKRALSRRGLTRVADDACGHAWMQLAVYADRIDSDRVFGWLLVVALRKGYALAGQDNGATLNETLEDGGGGPLHTALDRERLDGLNKLPIRQRRMVWLCGLGFSYREISALTGDTPRMVQRHLHRGRRRLAQNG